MVEPADAGTIRQHHVAVEQIFQIDLVVIWLRQIFAPHKQLAAAQGFCRCAVGHAFKQEQGPLLVAAHSRNLDTARRVLALLQPEGGIQKQGGVRMPVDADLPFDAVGPRQRTHMNPGFRHTSSSAGFPAG